MTGRLNRGHSCAVRVINLRFLRQKRSGIGRECRGTMRDSAGYLPGTNRALRDEGGSRLFLQAGARPGIDTPFNVVYQSQEAREAGMPFQDRCELSLGLSLGGHRPARCVWLYRLAWATLLICF